MVGRELDHLIPSAYLFIDSFETKKAERQQRFDARISVIDSLTKIERRNLHEIISFNKNDDLLLNFPRPLADPRASSSREKTRKVQ